MAVYFAMIGEQVRELEPETFTKMMLRVEYYYQTLLPYRALRFDFSVYAESLAEPAKIQLGIELDIEALKLDFDAIERIHKQVNAARPIKEGRITSFG
jgi:hypothetical protein